MDEGKTASLRRRVKDAFVSLAIVDILANHADILVYDGKVALDDVIKTIEDNIMHYMVVVLNAMYALDNYNDSLEDEREDSKTIEHYVHEYDASDIIRCLESMNYIHRRDGYVYRKEELDRLLKLTRVWLYCTTPYSINMVEFKDRNEDNIIISARKLYTWSDVKKYKLDQWESRNYPGGATKIDPVNDLNIRVSLKNLSESINLIYHPTCIGCNQYISIESLPLQEVHPLCDDCQDRILNMPLVEDIEVFTGMLVSMGMNYQTIANIHIKLFEYYKKIFSDNASVNWY